MHHVPKESRPMDLKFVPVADADRAFFIHVHHTAYRPVIEKMFGWDEALQDDFANKAFDGSGMNIIWLDGQKVGVVGYESYEDFLWLKEVFLLPEYQGRGIGTWIVKDAIAKAKLKGKELRLQTLKENTGAKRLYERHGFSVTHSNDTHWEMALQKS